MGSLKRKLRRVPRGRCTWRGCSVEAMPAHKRCRKHFGLRVKGYSAEEREERRDRVREEQQGIDEQRAKGVPW